jgi:hypothetical protein
MCVKMSSVSGVTRKLGRVKQRDSTVNSDRFSLVIFDCDGVLVDSELITNRIFATMLNELGIPVTLEDMFEQFVGRSMAAGLEKLQVYSAARCQTIFCQVMSRAPTRR